MAQPQHAHLAARVLVAASAVATAPSRLAAGVPYPSQLHPGAGLSRRALVGRAGQGVLALGVLAGLGGCGFRLRGALQFGFASLFIQAPGNSVLARSLQHTLAATAPQLQLLTQPTDLARAEAVLELQQEWQERVVAGLSASGQVRELQLRQHVRFRLYSPQGREWIGPTQLSQQRDISYNESVALAKEAEEALLFRDMRNDLVQQLLRRLSMARIS